MIRSYLDYTPDVDATAWLAPNVDVIGRVEVGADTSIWYQSVLRGDVNSITIGERSNIQDHTVIHNSGDAPCVVGDDVTVGHKVLLHGCEVQNLCLVGMGSIIMDHAVLEEGCFLAAGSLVPEGKVLKGGYLYAGSPARERRELTDEEKVFLIQSAKHYVKLSKAHRDTVTDVT
ncbi:gamma carbonic anhydrase family protein [Ghiorsea bivora]|uniref:gamma carbonic anhydrase family protein n=1 Tax=Ghiorsea bivora TaxID=1485545 RepID=UPI000570C770|nr:gamma carbonic anhydrase family protein [Ghiorsea bivora]